MNALARIAEPANTASPPPNRIEAEQALLGAILLHNEAYHAVAGFLAAEHFFEPVHRTLFAAIAATIAEGRLASPLTLRGALPAGQRIGDLDGQAYLARLAASAVSVSNAGEFGRIIVDMFLRRQVQDLAAGAIAATADDAPGSAARSAIAEAELQLLDLAELAALAEPVERREPQDYDSVLADVAERARSGRHYVGALTGLSDLDSRLGGLAAGELILIAGRPSMGKTALGLSMARLMARKGVGVAFDSLEMSEGAVRLRLLSDEAFDAGDKIAYQTIRAAKLNPDRMDAVRRAADRLKQLPLPIIARGSRLADIPTHIRLARRQMAAHERELEVFVVDYLGLIAPGDRYRGQKVQEVAEVSSMLKAIARRERVAMVALHQLNRANEGRDDKRPRLSDLRDSGSLEQDADIVIFVHRPAYYLERPGHSGLDETSRMEAAIDCQDLMEAIVAKHRQGPVGTVRLWCNMALNAVRDRAHGRMEH